MDNLSRKSTPDVTKQYVTKPNNKSNHKTGKYNSKTVTNLTILIIHAPVHDGKNEINFGIYVKNPCKHNKQFQVKYTYKFKL